METLQKEGEQDNVYKYEYDENGNNIKIHHFIEHDLYQTTEYKYDDNLPYEKIVTDASGTVVLRRFIEFDENGNRIEIRSGLKSVLERWIRTPEGVLIDHIVWNSKGEMQSGFTYSTDKNGTLILTVMDAYYLVDPSDFASSDFSIPNTFMTTTYEFDKNGEIAKITLARDGETTMFGIYEYNDDGSCARSSIYGGNKKVFLKQASYVELCQANKILGDEGRVFDFAIVEYDTEQNVRKVTEYDPDTWKIIKYAELGRNENYTTETYLKRNYDENGKLLLERQIAEDGTITEFSGDTGWTSVTKQAEDGSEKTQSFYAPDKVLFFTVKYLGANEGFELYDGEGNQVVKCEKVAHLGPDRQNGIYFERRYLIYEPDGSYTLLTCLYNKGEIIFTKIAQN